VVGGGGGSRPGGGWQGNKELIGRARWEEADRLCATAQQRAHDPPAANDLL
jgi:hypothetical protein